MFKVWDKISVSNWGKFKERIFLCDTEYSDIICVHKEDEEKFLNWDTKFRVGVWSLVKRGEDYIEIE
jgi:hypothetical protein